ncbi:hypothetical protein HB662_00930 [Roseomonas frigidaquae]|uniref:Flagellin C-terminal domain-containing protein n=1 Tax=Falsiroseomonas frigidaquae TaxID=487318 RepID=A0ABX1ERW4_9PROT|nr:flagellin [Falsiroseomonas frigidaquae]NKE43322.1 hypothetical protein [Falsiroseomonas frigidaquae]
MAVGGFPALDRVTTLSGELRARLNEQMRQAAGGQRADSYAGLGTDARRAVDLRAEMSRREVLTRTIATAESRASATQVTLKRLTAIATDFAGSANGLLGANAADATLLAQSARTALQDVAGLLNDRYGGEALFGGADLTQSPVPGEITKSGLFTQIRATLQGMTAGSGASTRTALRELGASDDPAVTPFSAYATAAAQGEIADPRRSVPVEAGVTVEIGLYANRNAAAYPSTAADSTGSWSRDLLYGLSVLANLGPDQAALGEDFTQVVQGAIGALRAGLSGVTEEAGALGTTERRLADARIHHEEVGAQVEQQVSALEEVDLAETITRLQGTQAQLEASYRVLAMLGNLSLTKFLS